MGKRRLAGRIFWSLFAASTVLLALSLTAARLFFPLLEDYRGEVQAWAGEILGQPVEIGELDARWRRLSPEVILRDVRLTSGGISESLQELDEVIISIDLLTLVLQQRVEFADLVVVLDHITVQRNEDGSIIVPELQRSQSSGSGGDEAGIVSWFLTQGNVSLTIKNLLWVDQRNLEQERFSDLTFSLRNDGNHHQLNSDFVLPAIMGESLQIAVEIFGDPLYSSDWRGRLFLGGRALKLSYWLDGREFEGKSLPSGEADFALWSDWAAFNLIRLDGSIALDGVEVLDQKSLKSRTLERLGANLEWQLLRDGWQFSVDDLQLSYNGHAWSRSSLAARVATNEQGVSQYGLRAGYLNLTDIADALSFFGGLDESAQQSLTDVAPRGVLKNVEAIFDGERGFSVEGALNKVSVNTWHAIPGVANLSGKLLLTAQGGVIDLDTRDGALVWPKMFRDSLSLGELRGRLSWVLQDEQWFVTSDRLSVNNQDVRGSASMAITLPLDKARSPFIDLAVAFQRGDGSRVSHYLPVGIMSDKTVEWLDQGVVDGHVTKGGMVYHGYSRDFPFNQGQGKFEVAFHAEDAVISPGEGWPKIAEINADVTFAGSAMEVLASKGRLYDSQLSATRVAIADMRGAPARLTIDGRVEGPTINALRYLLESPLHDRFSYLDMFVIEGASALDLALDIPLASGYEVAVSGQVKVDDNSLLITPAKLPLTAVQGSLAFSSDHGVEAESISGELYGHPLAAKVSSHTNGEGSATVIEAAGQFDGVALAKYFESPLIEKLVVGQAPITVQVYVPRRGADEKLPTTVQLSSPLTGIAIDLIPPFSKDAESERKLVVDISLPEGKVPVINLDYGDQLSGILAVDKVLRGEVVFGEGTPQLSELSGLGVIGEIPELSVTALTDRFAHLSDKAAGPNQDALALDILSSLDLTIGRFEVLGQQLSPLRVVATRMADQWVLDVDSPEMAGKLYLAKQYMQEPLIMELDHLKLAKVQRDEDESKSRPLVLDSLPPLQVTSKQFLYDDMSLGNLKLSSYKDAAGYYIDHLSVAPASATINLRGEWLVRDESQRSSINVKVDSRDVGKTLDALKYGGVINKGEGTLEVKLTWPDSPTEFAGNILNGDLTIKLEDGRLLDVEPGAGGRMLGLLAWQGIGRRLTLDFSDIFSKGFTFNHIKGGYALSKGVATTNDLSIEGPSARVDITGAVDLGEQQYDLRALVTPHVTDNLPILGALAATPQVGAVLWLTQKLFKKELDKIAQFEYSIVGPWDSPVTKKIGDEK